LRLLVRKGGSKCWILRYQLNKRRRDMGLGRYPETTLAMARDRALAIRREIDATRRDPLAERQRVKALTFKAAAEALIGSKESGWRNAKHAAQWPTTLQTYVYPKLGDLDVRSIDTRSVLEVLRPIWNEKPVTASRVRQRIEAVVDYATAMGSRAGDNPARWKGLLDNLLPKPSKVKQVEHLAALDWRHTPAFMIALAKRDGSAAKALAFAILTAARSGEVRGLTWAEIDDADAVWTIPANRTKAGKEHRVPLTAAARALLGARSEASKLVFGSLANPSRPLTDTALMHALRRMGRGDLTAHGFRSTFRDWAGETTAHPREVIEAALAHQLKDKAEAAYARGDLFVKRRKLMDDWAAFLAKPAGEVLPMTAERQVAAKG
jgi:integrase